MEIRILELIEGAKQAKGLTVIIDVLRAFSLECYLYHYGAETVRPVGSVGTGGPSGEPADRGAAGKNVRGL